MSNEMRIGRKISGAIIISIMGLIVSGCTTREISCNTTTAITVNHPLPAQTDTIMSAKKQLPSATPEIFASGDDDLYDNFNDRQYDGSYKEGLWQVADQDAQYVLQKDGYLSIQKQNNSDECLVAAASNYRGLVPVTPFFIQADLRMEKQVSNGLAGYYIVGTSKDRGFMSSCSIGLNSQNQLAGVCVNHWWDGNDKENPISEHFVTTNIPINYMEWHTFRIDYDPRAYLFTYFIDNNNVGSYQVVDTASIRKATFELYLNVCLIDGASYEGNFDNVRIGLVKA